MQYAATFAHSPEGIPGTLKLDASNDEDAKTELRTFVESGYRNETWGSVPLSDGSIYSVRNSHGRAVARIVPATLDLFPLRVLGFVRSDEGRVWRADGSLGVHINEDGTLTLLNSEGVPSSHVLALDHAVHILGRAQQYEDDCDLTMRRWDAYANSL